MLRCFVIEAGYTEATWHFFLTKASEEEQKEEETQEAKVANKTLSCGSTVIPGDGRMVMGKVKLLSSEAEGSVKESVQH